MDNSGYNFLCPALFFEVQEVSSEVLGLGSVAQDLHITTHIIHEELDATDGSLDQNLNVFDWRTYVRETFTGLDVPNLNTLMYYKEHEDYKHNNYYHFKVIWKTKYFDQSGNPFANGRFTRIPTGNWHITKTDEFVDNINEL
jgi:hypothetical protein